MMFKNCVLTTLVVIAAAHPLNSASNGAQSSQFKDKDVQITGSGYWFSYNPGSACSKCNCSVEVIPFDPYYFPSEQLIYFFNKSDCTTKTTTGSECTCYGYPDYFIGMSNRGFINGSMGDSKCVGAELRGSSKVLNCQGRYRSETLVLMINCLAISPKLLHTFMIL